MDQAKEPFCTACLCYAKDFLDDEELQIAECMPPSLCPPVPAPEIMIRDCETDDGTLFTSCPPGPPDSPDIHVNTTTEPSGEELALNYLEIDMTACATNIGGAIPSGYVYAKFLVALETDLGSRMTQAEGTWWLPTGGGQATRMLEAPPGDPPLSPDTPWATGERRCMSAPTRFALIGPDPQRELRVTVTLWTPGDPPNSFTGAELDNNRAAKAIRFGEDDPSP